MVALVGDTRVSALFTWPRKLRRAPEARVSHGRVAHFSLLRWKRKYSSWEGAEWSTVHLAKFIPRRACVRLLLKHEEEYLPLREIKVENISANILIYIKTGGALHIFYCLRDKNTPMILIFFLACLEKASISYTRLDYNRTNATHITSQLNFLLLIYYKYKYWYW